MNLNALCSVAEALAQEIWFKLNSTVSMPVFQHTIKRLLLPFLLLSVVAVHSQKKIPVYKIGQLQKRISNTSDTLYIVNFWATWCKPCVAELPDFEKINTEFKTKKVKVLLVSMDFKEDMKKRVIPFLKKNKYKSETIILDETDGKFIDMIDKDWSGAIPATLFIRRDQREFVFKKISYGFLLQKTEALTK
ncbi:MAG: TlpA family protein disulfide reductase [Bacteroidetes bacterium]|jgi:thiol-disulfide isomerase/thioredoxin|nr:TlpA family protein disulfide reductase [Bacteroidota bacterium]